MPSIAMAGVFGVGGMNLAFNKLSGITPEALLGSRVNAMDEYGKSGQKGTDNAAWKACGQECIDGVFYAFVSRNIYGNDSGDPLTRQLAQNSSLIKSTDRGRTWFRSAEQNLNRPMWPGAPFGTRSSFTMGKMAATSLGMEPWTTFMPAPQLASGMTATP